MIAGEGGPPASIPAARLSPAMNGVLDFRPENGLEGICLGATRGR